ncbi:MAG: DNA (cytosine-5-)-methyltransferase [Pseudomonas sp.]|nr:DNA (cytosine-5-)-methyltransferase [Pseudomonas sp.]|tara:strand:- start:1225 stop:2331 length:1107 start_codon:yes stop_codon:yes gene_type:complete
MSSINTVDLFCGAGGFTEGFNKAGDYKTIFAIDFDKQAVDTFNYNHPEATAYCRDIASISQSEIIELARQKDIHVVIGGPPCQGFSLAGLRLPDDPKNQLFKEYVRFINVLQPEIFVFENVSGIVSMQGGLALEAICNEFSREGYELSYQILNSADYGVPQARPRFIMIGSRSGKRIPMPTPTHTNKIDSELDLFDVKRISHVTVKDALSNLATLGQGEGNEVSENDPPLTAYQKLIYGARQPGILYNHRATSHSQKIVERYAAMPQGGNIKSLPPELRTKKNNVYRLNEALPSRTVTCNFRTDILHPWQPRGLTTREAARLQSFDDDYRFFGNLTRKAKYVTQDDQVGNAVPPLLAKALAQHIKDYL